MQFTSFEKKVLTEVLKTYFDEQEMEWLPQDKYGNYYSNDDTSYDEPYAARVANTIKNLLIKINSVNLEQNNH